MCKWCIMFPRRPRARVKLLKDSHIKVPSSAYLEFNLDRLLVLQKVITPLLEGRFAGLGLEPEVWRQEGVGLPKCFEGSFHEVTFCSGVTAGTGEAICYTTELEHLFKSRGPYNSRTTRSGD